MGLEVLFLLLPVAALSGWWIGRKSDEQRAGMGACSEDYFKGLNYLLNEQSDKAIEVFVRMLEVDSDTIETHFALGSLFRRRGEVERAIRIHQNLIARPTLTLNQRGEALFQLARDYLAAGLLDRAENLFLELKEQREFETRALQQLLDIYQQEKDWKKAITVAERLQGVTRQPAQPLIAHFRCELAEQALNEGELTRAYDEILKALSIDPQSVRASLLEAQAALAGGETASALLALQRIEQQDPDFLPEAIPSLQNAFRPSNTHELKPYLTGLLERHAGTSILLALAEEVRRTEGEAEAINVVTDHVRRHPSVWGVWELVNLKLRERQQAPGDDLVLIQELMKQLLEMKPRYRCKQCGFTGRSLYWQCPSCKSWSTIKPIQGIEGE